MTKKEKAKELLDKMSLDWYCNECHNDFAKECALIAVDEILKAVQSDWSFMEVRQEYWQKVKQEILNL